MSNLMQYDTPQPFNVRAATSSQMYFNVVVLACSESEAIELAKVLRPGCDRYSV